MVVLVTGAGGFIGQHLVPDLLASGHTVVALSRQTPLVEHPRLCWMRGDLTDRTMLDGLPGDVDGIIHLATAGTRRHQAAGGGLDCEAVEEITRVNVMATVALLHFASKRGVRRFVFTSSMAVYARPPRRLPVQEDDPCYPVGSDLSYAASKLVGELYCQEFLRARGLSCSVLRLAYIYGRGMSEDRVIPAFMLRAARGEPIRINGSGEESWDFLYVGDAVRGIRLALEGDARGVFNLGSGEETTLNQLARCVLDVHRDSGSRIVQGSPGEHDGVRFYMDIARARASFGFGPNVALATGLAEYKAADAPDLWPGAECGGPR
jgi:nucleoside-diphosphate-sugar epimerase